MKILNQIKPIILTTLFFIITQNTVAGDSSNLVTAQNNDKTGEKTQSQNEIPSKEANESPGYILNMAFHYYNEYDYDKAILYFEKYIKLAGEEEVSLTHLGKIYLNLKNSEKSISYFQRALKLNPKNIDTLLYLAEIYLNDKNQIEAIKVLESIVELDPVNERALFTLAEIYASKKDQRKSMVYYKKLSLATLKNSANLRLLNKAYTNIARYYYDIQDYEKALEYYEKIIEISPEDYNSAYIYAELLKVNGKFRNSADVMISLLNKDPLNQEVLESLVESLFIIDDFRTRGYLKRYMENTPNANSLFWGMDNLFKGNLPSAQAEFQKVLKKNPNRISAHIGVLNSIPKDDLEERKKEAYTIVILTQKIKAYNMAPFYMDQVFQILERESKSVNFQNKLNKPEHDIQLTKEEEKLVNEYIDSFYTHAISLENENYAKQAQAYYLECLRYIDDQLAILENKFTPDEYLHFEKKLFQAESRDFNDDKNRESTLSKIKSLREKKYEALLNYNWLSYKNKESSAKNLAENIEVMDQDPRAYFLNGIISFENARDSKDDISKYKMARDFFTNAIHYFERSSEKKTAPANYYFYLGITGDKLGDFNLMDNSLNKSIELDPYNSVYLNYLGYMYSVKNMHLDKAFDLIKRGLEDDPENDAYLDSLGWVYFKMNKFDEALGQLLVARTLSEKKGRKDPVIDFHIAETYKKLNNNNQAVRFFKTALENIQNASEPLDKNFIESQIKILSAPQTR